MSFDGNWSSPGSRRLCICSERIAASCSHYHPHWPSEGFRHRFLYSFSFPSSSICHVSRLKRVTPLLLQPVTPPASPCKPSFP
jgi:hypothetical protein